MLGKFKFTTYIPKLGLLALRKLKQQCAVAGELERPMSMCMNGEKSCAGRRSLHDVMNLYRLS